MSDFLFTVEYFLLYAHLLIHDFHGKLKVQLSDNVCTIKNFYVELSSDGRKLICRKCFLGPTCQLSEIDAFINIQTSVGACT